MGDIQIKTELRKILDDIEYLVGNNELTSAQLFTDMRDLINTITNDHLKAIEDQRLKAKKQCEKWDTICAEKLNQIEDKDAEIEKLQTDIQFMVKKHADNHLEGYREQGRLLAEKDAEIDRLRARMKELEESYVKQPGCMLK